MICNLDLIEGLDNRNEGIHDFFTVLTAQIFPDALQNHSFTMFSNGPVNVRPAIVLGRQVG